MKKFLLALFILPLLLSFALESFHPAVSEVTHPHTTAASEMENIHTETVEYRQGNTILEGYLAYNHKLDKPSPGVMIVHAWKGLGEYEKRRARQLAEMGYVAFAADIYGKGIRPQSNEEAGKQAGIYRSNRPLLRDRANAGLQVLQQHPLVEDDKITAIGYCFGGGTVLELARSGAPVAGVVSFHGNLDTPNPADAKNIQGKVLVLHGANDPLVPPAQVQAFVQEMRDAEVDWHMTMYGNAVHSFTEPEAGDDPSKGTAYNAKADRRSWQAMQDFFKEIFEMPASNS
ncbi:dienelactone hydrolase family protein [Oscillatoria sp. FACHB-1406]|uniref:dienelactone hydrolase family protein n=1 Tax=Oscillatoria sp. FACHB-1406 TaxID=2692846 RepID=UPI00168A2B80|nr:dienelactone hydrolase family protein [Oscillatoria sp. FACHB-1406]MBD2576889.1 dienelactone hydrolase family protein [Oscillatoria sp. FACHB-1406]